MNKLDILFTSDENYLTIMLTSTLSILKNSQVKDLTFHFITTNLSENANKKLDNFISKYSSDNIKFYKYKLDEKELEKYNIPKWRGTNIANARLVFNELIQDNISSSKLLYLDCDTITVSNFDGLEQYKDKSLCLVKDNAKLTDRRLINLNHYYNSGVMLIDINDWNKKGYQEKILKEIKRAQDYKYPDQDLINNALKEEISDLDFKYNVRPYTYLFKDKELERYYSKREGDIDEIKESVNSPVILHGCGLGGIKPWSKNTIFPFNDIFMEYILEVDPNFEKIDLNKVQQLFNDYPILAKKYVMMRNYLPENLNDLLSTLSLKMQGATSKKVSNKEKIYKK